MFRGRQCWTVSHKGASVVKSPPLRNWSANIDTHVRPEWLISPITPKKSSQMDSPAFSISTDSSTNNLRRLSMTGTANCPTTAFRNSRRPGSYTLPKRVRQFHTSRQAVTNLTFHVAISLTVNHEGCPPWLEAFKSLAHRKQRTQPLRIRWRHGKPRHSDTKASPVNHLCLKVPTLTPLVNKQI